MDERRVAEYFIVAGLPPTNPVPLAEFSCDGANLKSTHSLPPVTDIGVVNRSLGEVVPDGYTCIEYTVGGILANLNHGVLRSQEVFLCYRRGRDKPPLVDIGVLLEGRERLLPDSQVVEFTVGNHNANINPNGIHAYITYRRATEESTCNELVVSDICLIMTNKGETAPHSYCTIDRNLNKGTMMGSDIYLCYRKSVNRTNYLAYKAGILDLYPMESRPSFPVPNSLALFCLPMGATLEAWPPQAATPDNVFSTFVLTILPTGSSNPDSPNEGVEKVYGAAITFYERYPHEKLTPQQREDLQLNDHFGRRNLIHTNKCICILSMWPFFDTFEKFLKYLHKMAHSYNHKVPIERYIWHMLERVPFPSERRPRILIQLDAYEGISLAQLEDSPIPLSGASFRKLVMCLRPEGCLLVLLYALTEQKILLHSLRPDVLTAVAEAFTMIIFPFHWQCPYIPLCPLGLSDLLDAPTPFLLGLDSRFFDLYDPPSDVICIDLDTAAISIPEDKKHLTTKLLPKKPARIFKSSLEALCGTIKAVDEQLQEHHLKPNLMLDQNIDSDFKIKRKEQELEVEIQETFLRFTATILKGYSQYLLPIVTVKPNDSKTPSLFDVEGFIRSRDRAYQKFYEMLVSTQMFSKFIEERSFVSDKDVSLVFFDDCIEKVTEEEFGSRLLEVEPASSEITFFLPPPEPPLHAPIDGYAYEGFPKLRQDLFPVKEPSKILPVEVSTPQKGSGFGSPGSPLARRSKHEVKSAQKMASKHYQTPMMWAKCLLSTCFSLWFAHLPAFISIHAQKGRVLDLAFYILQRMQRLTLSHQDEVCYRVMMQLCGVYSKPVLAVKTFCEMRNAGIIPNAITYGYYNRALLESKGNPSNLLWNKLRNVMMSVRAFRQSGVERAQRRKSSLSLDDVDKLSSDSTSRLSLESGASVDSHPPSQFKTDTLSSDPGYCSISENCDNGSVPVVSPSSNVVSTLDEVDLTCSERSQSVPSLSPISPPNPEPPPSSLLPDSPPSSSSESSSSPTATVAYDTAPSSPLQPPPSTLQSPPSTLQSPPSTLQSPPSTLQSPPSTLQSPPSTLQSPPSTLQSPPSTFQSPPSTLQSPPSTLQSPPSTLQSPPSTLQSPPSTLQSPPSTLQSPPSTLQSPPSTLQSPPSTLQSPPSTLQSPPSTLQSPPSTLQSPPSTLQPRPSSAVITTTTTASSLCPSFTATPSPSPSSSPGPPAVSSPSSLPTQFSQTGAAPSRASLSSGLDFAASNALRRRLGSIVRSSSAGLSSGVQLSLLETHPLLVNTAGLLMTSPLDGTYLTHERPLRDRPTDLAEHLSEALEKYDQIREPSMPMPTTFDPSHTDRGPPEYFRSSNFGKDERIVKKLLQLVYPSEETVAAGAGGSASSPLEQQPEAETPLETAGKTADEESKEEPMPPPPREAAEKTREGVSNPQDGFVDCDDDDSTASDQSSNASGVKSFFSRSTPERLSNLWRKGVLGADEKFRGIWRKTAAARDSNGVGSRTTGGDKPRARSEPTVGENERSPGARKPPKRPSLKEGSPSSLQEKTHHSHHHRNPLTKKKKPVITVSSSDSEKEVQLISFDEASPEDSSSAFSPVVAPQELIEGTGRHRVLAGDPLGALETKDDPSPPPPSPDPLTQASPEEQRLESPSEPEKSSRRVGIGRSYTFTNASTICSQSSESLNAEDECSKKTASTSLWTLNPPFSGEEFHSSPKDLQMLSANQSDLSTDDALVLPWAPSFRLPLSGTSTLGLASSVASQGFRQASKHIESLRTQYIDPAMTELASQSNFNYRKNELISGSLNSMRSAVTSLSKRYSLIRDAIIPTPVKINWRMDDPEDDLVDGFWSRRESYETGLSDDGVAQRRSSLRASSDEGEVDRSLPSSWSVQGPFCLGIWITSCSRCHKCKGLLYDEEIMSGWHPDNSNLNTKCWHCNKLTVPLLTVTRFYLRHTPKDTQEKVSSQQPSTKESTSLGTPQHGASKKSKKDSNLRHSEEEVIAFILEKGKKLEPLTFPYLSPLVLRKELETMLGHDGDSCLTLPSFPDHHPILYWNMLWYFSRLHLPSHLSGLCLTSPSLLKDEPIHDSWKDADWRNVYVRCLWDNTHFHQELGSPLYMQWKESYNPSILVKALTPHRAKTPKDVLESFLTLLHVNQVERCLDIMMQSLKKRPAELKYNHYPVYRDLLFFALTALPRDQININGFEQEFRREFEKALPKHRKVLNETDGAPPIPSVFCRKYFFDLSL